MKCSGWLSSDSTVSSAILHSQKCRIYLVIAALPNVMHNLFEGKRLGAFAILLSPSSKCMFVIFVPNFAVMRIHLVSGVIIYVLTLQALSHAVLSISFCLSRTPPRSVLLFCMPSHCMHSCGMVLICVLLLCISCRCVHLTLFLWRCILFNNVGHYVQSCCRCHMYGLSLFSLSGILL